MQRRCELPFWERGLPMNMASNGGCFADDPSSDPCDDRLAYCYSRWRHIVHH